MIEISFLKQLELDGFGTIDVDMFWQDAPLDNKSKPVNCIWLVSRGGEVSRLNTNIQPFDIYARNTSKLEAAAKLKAILDKMADYYGSVCTLPAVEPYFSNEYTNVTIQPTSGIEAVGSDDQDRMIFVISGELRY